MTKIPKLHAKNGPNNHPIAGGKTTPPYHILKRSRQEQPNHHHGTITVNLDERKENGTPSHQNGRALTPDRHQDTAVAKARKLKPSSTQIPKYGHRKGEKVERKENRTPSHQNGRGLAPDRHQDTAVAKVRKLKQLSTQIPKYGRREGEKVETVNPHQSLLRTTFQRKEIAKQQYSSTKQHVGKLIKRRKQAKGTWQPQPTQQIQIEDDEYKGPVNRHQRQRSKESQKPQR
ncbi:hypothetical protein A2U01_0007179 [Trifolium medium]|uniref:Uncharacterized protein n=1 Tax=Trifolium medium TaxID=97028 RepID=A0A392MJ92_9FABA|nr:hypothetical protein [Trifolium medium]